MLQTESENFLTTKEAAQRLNCHDWHIRGLLRSGILKGTKISHKAWRIPEASIQELIDSGSNFLKNT